MMGWVIAFAFAATVLGALLLARLPRVAWEITGAALLLGLAGYAWQGRPGLVGAPRRAVVDATPGPDAQIAAKRRDLARVYGPTAQWMVMSDAYASRGHMQEAATILLSGLRAHPRDTNLWMALGNALMAHMDGTLSPAADYAYRRAVALDEKALAPRYFYGLALIRAGNLQGARTQWATVAAAVPAGSPFRAELDAGIARIDAMMGQGGTADR